jgi:hypothetical protein
LAVGEVADQLCGISSIEKFAARRPALATVLQDYRATRAPGRAAVKQRPSNRGAIFNADIDRRLADTA